MNDDFFFEEDTDNEEGFDRSGIDESLNNDDSCDYDDEDLSLGFVRKVGTESGKINVYEFIFTTHQDEFWGQGFEYFPSGVCNFLEPDLKYIQKIVKVRMNQELSVIQDNNCFSMQDCMDGIIAVAWQDLTHEEEYPEYRLVFHFGEKYTDVEDKLARCHILMNV